MPQPQEKIFIIDVREKPGRGQSPGWTRPAGRAQAGHGQQGKLGYERREGKKSKKDPGHKRPA